MGGGEWAAVMAGRVDRIIDGKRVDYWGSAMIRHQRAEGHPATWGSWIRLEWTRSPAQYHMKSTVKRCTANGFNGYRLWGYVTHGQICDFQTE